ncbi:dihydroorotase [Taibaiella chishuiensis]|uniref:Dihydroorotase n=1 Tax=Taibaiella chishuiensis TaxID=1434707 RepID=A0A2P8CZB6_9BACT|nr:dihydroorotase [Taibaiella chishuiensis]PSK90318.1 dihydroorotase [Taibaiella chishuiensis]
MSLLIKNATVLDPQSPLNGKQSDILIRKGTIAAIGKKLTDKADKVIEGEALYVSPGWVDVLADYCDPGYEQKETISSGLNAAAAGGFTDVLIVPNTLPVIGTKSILEYVQHKSAGHKAGLHVLGAISKNTEGKELAEMMDMHHSGAIGFSDGWHPVQHAGLMLKALEYVKAFNGIIVQLPVQASLSAGGLMHEGEQSVRLGMPGIPGIAESLIVHRDIELVRYTGSRLHFSGVSTPESLALIRAAKKEGLDITCSVTPYHLLFTDEKLKGYDSVYKVEPPLRTEAERKLLVKALSDGTIDCIATHHRPQEWDAKAKEFEYAQPGMAGQETCLAMLLEAAPKIEPARWVELLSLNARKIFGLQTPVIAEGAAARLTVFDTAATWTYTEANKQTVGINSPWIGKTLTGKTY